MLLVARDESSGEGITDQQIRDEIITFLIAGHETVASVLTWTWYLLAQHPEVDQKWKRALWLQLSCSMFGCGWCLGARWQCRRW